MSVCERSVNDVGGMEGDKIDQSNSPQTLFEKRVDALVMLLTHPDLGAFKVDGLRRAIEMNSPEDYAKLGYYPKWIRAVRQLLVEQKVLSDEEIDAKIEELRKSAVSQSMDQGYG